MVVVVVAVDERVGAGVSVESTELVFAFVQLCLKEFVNLVAGAGVEVGIVRTSGRDIPAGSSLAALHAALDAMTPSPGGEECSCTWINGDDPAYLFFPCLF